MRWNHGKKLAAATRVVTIVSVGLLLAACGGKTAGGTSSTSQAGGTSPGSSSSTSAGSSTSTSSAAASGSSFCSIAASLAKVDIARELSGSPTARTVFQTLLSQEPTILAAAPGQLQAPLQKLFSFYNRLVSELAKVNYNFTKLSTTDKAGIVSQSQSLAAASRQVENYLTGTCKLKSSTGG